MADAQRTQLFADRLPMDAPEHRGQIDRVHAGLARESRCVVAPVRYALLISGGLRHIPAPTVQAIRRSNRFFTSTSRAWFAPYASRLPSGSGMKLT